MSGVRDTGDGDEPLFGVPLDHRVKLEEGEWTLEMGLAFVLVCAHPNYATPNNKPNFECLDPSPKFNTMRAGARQRFSAWLRRAGAAVSAGKLAVADPPMKRLAAEALYDKVWVKPGDLVAWCLNQDEPWQMPDELRRLPESDPTERNGSAPSHPALDPSHPHYSMELASALRAWEALFMNRGADEPKPPGGYLKLINGWVAKQGSSLGINARERIVSVVNPYKGGGAAPSETKKTVGG